MVPPCTPASPKMIEDRMNFYPSIERKTTFPITVPSDHVRNCGGQKITTSISPGDPSSEEDEKHCESSPGEPDLSENKCSEMNKKNSESSKESIPARKVRANHRRNLSLDFRAMGIELPPLSEVVPSTTLISPPRRLPNIPEHNAPVEIAHQQPAITPKIKHVMRRILSRRIN